MTKRNTAEKPEDTAAAQPAAQLSPEREPGDEPIEEAKRPFQPVRDWTTRAKGPLKYRKFTDADLKIVGFKFQLGPTEKLPEEALAIMRDHKQDKDGNPTGLVFKDTRKHGKIWLLPNDVEGRTVADKIDYRLSEIAQKMEEGQQRAPF